MGRTQGQGIVLNAPQIEVGEVLLLVYKVVVKSKKKYAFSRSKLPSMAPTLKPATPCPSSRTGLLF